MGAGHLLLAHPGSTVVTVFAGPPGAVPGGAHRVGRAGRVPRRRRRRGHPAHRRRRRARRSSAPSTGGWTSSTTSTSSPRRAQHAEQMAPALDSGDRRGATDRGRAAAGARQPRPRGDARRRDARRRDAPELTWFGYEDAGYKHIPGMLAWRVSKLFQSDLWPTPMIVPTVQDHARKRTAIECYRSQLGPLYADHALEARHRRERARAVLDARASAPRLGAVARAVIATCCSGRS